MKTNIPKEVLNIMEKLQSKGFEAFLVGGCVRDLLLKKTPTDWDITTNAQPIEIQKIFPKSIYENKFGTVMVITKSPNPNLKTIEVTTYRVEAKYRDKRHPEVIKFTDKIDADLARRDFTINAMAMDQKGQILDLFGGQKDLKNKLVRAVGNPKDRFDEDALRLIRAVRLASQLSFSIEPKTFTAIKEKAPLLQFIAKERIRDELIKLIMSEGAAEGIFFLQKTGLLRFVIPELEEGIGVKQNKHHIYTVFDHNVYSLGYAVKYGYNLETRLAALLHDIAKPKTKRGQYPQATFYGHDVVGAKMTYQILTRLRFPKAIIKKVTLLVRYHLFYYDVGEVTESAVRRLVRRVGPENIKDLINLRIAERKGSGVPKARPYRLRHLEFMIEKVLRQPLSLKQLKINGDEVMAILKIEPGPKVGYILNALMNEVIENPNLNKKDYLKKQTKMLGKIPESELKLLAQAGKEKLSQKEKEAIKQIKKKYYVK